MSCSKNEKTELPTRNKQNSNTNKTKDDHFIRRQGHGQGQRRGQRNTTEKGIASWYQIQRPALPRLPVPYRNGRRYTETGCREAEREKPQWRQTKPNGTTEKASKAKPCKSHGYASNHLYRRRPRSRQDASMYCSKIDYAQQTRRLIRNPETTSNTFQQRAVHLHIIVQKQKWHRGQLKSADM